MTAGHCRAHWLDLHHQPFGTRRVINAALSAIMPCSRARTSQLFRQLRRLLSAFAQLQVSIGYRLEPPIPMKYFSPALQRALHFGTSALQTAMPERCRSVSGMLALAQPTHSVPCSEQERAAAVSIEARTSIPINNAENRIVPLPQLPRSCCFIEVEPSLVMSDEAAQWQAPEDKGFPHFRSEICSEWRT
jgi:hypothetical protein